MFSVQKLWPLAVLLAAVGCKSETGGSPSAAQGREAAATTKTRAAPSGAAPGSSSKSSAAPVRVGPTIEKLPELSPYFAREITDKAWASLNYENASEQALYRPLQLVRNWVGGGVQRFALPFDAQHVVAYHLTEARVAYHQGLMPKQKLRVWQSGTESPEIVGIFKGGAVGKTQALILTGEMNQLGFASSANGKIAHRLVKGAWSEVTLPAPPEPGWEQCHFQAKARYHSDDVYLLQICAAADRKVAYALYELLAESPRPERLPLDNAELPAQSMGGAGLYVEDDGAVNLVTKSYGANAAMTVARRLPGRDGFVVFTQQVGGRMMSSAGFSGSRVLLSDGSGVLRVSADGGQSFQELPGEEVGTFALAGCSQLGCLMTAPRRRTVLRPWQ